MSEETWEDKYRNLCAAMLPPAPSARERLESLDSIKPILLAAMTANVRGLLTSDVLDQLIEIAGIDEEPRDTAEVVPLLDASAGARTVAPINEPQIKPAARPHGLPHFDLSNFPMEAKDVDMELEVHFDITGNSVTEGRMSDILACFNDRFATISRMLIESRTLPNRPTKIGEIINNKTRYREDECTILGIVGTPEHTKNGHLRFILEDEGTEIQCLLKNRFEDDPNLPINAGLMPDDIIGVTGRLADQQRGRKDLFFVEDIHLPTFRRHEKACAPVDQAISVAFLSDVHLGSKTFLSAQWEKMVNWFNTDPLAKTIRYFVLSGDGVDGVGIYPNQEKELAIPDLFNQYRGLAELLEPLPDWVDVLLLPGNHDAVRPAEPQPALDPELQQHYNNTTFVGNPCDFSLHGVRILSYHGKSIDDFVAKMRSVSYDRPEAAMRAMIDRRHLAPAWGGKTPLSPEPEDNLVIRTVPDIFVTGHVHGHHVSDHKGVTLIHSSTWQDQTSYQRTLGFQPRPAILTVVNLHTHETASIPFA